MKDQLLKEIIAHGKEICVRRTGMEINKFVSLNYTQTVNLNITKMKKNTKEQLQLDQAQKLLKKANQHF